MTVVWSADEGTYKAHNTDERDAAIRKFLHEIQDEPASADVTNERRRARLRWPDLEPGAIDVSRQAYCRRPRWAAVPARFGYLAGQEAARRQADA